MGFTEGNEENEGGGVALFSSVSSCENYFFSLAMK